MAPISALDGTHVVERGHGPSFIVVHGWRLDSTAESGIYEGIESLRAWRRLYVDLPGMGQSDVRPSLRSLGDYSAWLGRALHELAQDRPYVLAATSAGALLGMHALLADAAPLPVGLLVRVPLTSATHADRVVPREELPSWARRRRSAVRKNVWQAAEQRASQHVRDLRDDPERYALPLPNGVLQMPAAIVAGRQDTRVGFAGAVDLMSVLPHATLAVVDGAEHEYPYGSDALFSAIVADLIQRVSNESV